MKPKSNLVELVSSVSIRLVNSYDKASVLDKLLSLPWLKKIGEGTSIKFKIRGESGTPEIFLDIGDSVRATAKYNQNMDPFHIRLQLLVCVLSVIKLLEGFVFADVNSVYLDMVELLMQNEIKPNMVHRDFCSEIHAELMKSNFVLSQKLAEALNSAEVLKIKNEEMLSILRRIYSWLASDAVTGPGGVKQLIERIGLSQVEAEVLRGA
ncbi:MAG: hypothetical protein QXN59_00395 [Candidatus Micrarchaeaceae archaeon]